MNLVELVNMRQVRYYFLNGDICCHHFVAEVRRSANCLSHLEDKFQP